MLTVLGEIGFWLPMAAASLLGCALLSVVTASSYYIIGSLYPEHVFSVKAFFIASLLAAIVSIVGVCSWASWAHGEGRYGVGYPWTFIRDMGCTLGFLDRKAVFLNAIAMFPALLAGLLICWHCVSWPVRAFNRLN